MRRLGRRAVAAVVAALALLMGESEAADFNVRWRPSTSPGVTSYNVYFRTNGSAFGTPRNAALPAVAGDGSMSYVVTGLQAGVAYRFAVAARAATVESALSNEIGVCGSAADCDDRNPCTSDVCSAGVCSNPPGNDGASCADGNACNGTDTCQGGTCQSSGPPNCNDNNPCTTDSCAAQNGCQHVLVSGCQTCTTSGNCSDNNPCNGTEACVSGRCQSGTPLTCNDNNACTTDSCSAQAGCVFTPLASCQSCTSNTQCDNGNACDGSETCLSGRCRPATTALDCNDADPCTADSCNPASGCTHQLQDTCYSCDLRAQATLYATRVTLKRSGYGIHFRAAGVLEPTGAVDPMRTGIVFDIQRPGTGEVFYRAIVPGSALVSGVAGNTIRLPQGADVDTAPGLKFLRIRRLSTGRYLVAVFGKAEKMPSAFPVELGWTLMLGDQCGSDRCMAYSRSSDCR